MKNLLVPRNKVRFSYFAGMYVLVNLNNCVVTFIMSKGQYIVQTFLSVCAFYSKFVGLCLEFFIIPYGASFWVFLIRVINNRLIIKKPLKVGSIATPHYGVGPLKNVVMGSQLVKPIWYNEILIGRFTKKQSEYLGRTFFSKIFENISVLRSYSFCENSILFDIRSPEMCDLLANAVRHTYVDHPLFIIGECVVVNSNGISTKGYIVTQGSTNPGIKLVDKFVVTDNNTVDFIRGYPEIYKRLLPDNEQGFSPIHLIETEYESIDDVFSITNNIKLAKYGLAAKNKFEEIMCKSNIVKFDNESEMWRPLPYPVTENIMYGNNIINSEAIFSTEEQNWWTHDNSTLQNTFFLAEQQYLADYD